MVMKYVLKRVNQDGKEEVLLTVELPAGCVLKLEQLNEVTTTIIEAQG
jgi:hypothetical protein